MIDVVLAWLVAEDDGAKKRIQEVLADRNEDLSLVKATLKGTWTPSLRSQKSES
jgi:beta-catenin-like protein 1